MNTIDSTDFLLRETVVSQNNLIWVKPVCDFFDLDVRNQHKKIKNDPILGKMVGKNTPSFGNQDQYGRIWLTKNGFVRWIQIINPNIVRKDLRAQFIEFQTMIFDYLFGSIEREELVRVDFVRLKKLKSLYGKVGAEIQRCEKGVQGYLDEKFGQLSLFNQDQKKIV